MKRIRIIVKGHVQGVFFRQFVKDRAESLGLSGYTKNISNNLVEVTVEGHEAKLKELIDICKRGPIGAQIEEVRVNSEPYIGEFNTFRIKY